VTRLALASKQAEKRSILSFRKALLFALGFGFLWLACFELYRATPYLRSSSDVIKHAKQQYVLDGDAFPAPDSQLNVAVFGDSKVLSGLIPAEFDRLAQHDSLEVYSYNSGYPAQSESEFIDELETMTEHGNPPNVVLLVFRWPDKARRFSAFHLSADDNQIADRVFPFRLMARNVARFIASSGRFGGPVAFYRKSRTAADQVLRDRGYYFIKELSLFAGDRLPADYSLPSDKPNAVLERKVNFESAELDRLNGIVEQHKISCFFVPTHHRSNEAAPAPADQAEFARQLAEDSPCRVLGPDYFSYPLAFYSDWAHLNPEGAKHYTRDLYDLSAPYLKGAR
jgi:hypothetical protein